MAVPADFLHLVKQGYVGSTPDGWWSAIQWELDDNFSEAIVFRNDEVVVLEVGLIELSP